MRRSRQIHSHYLVDMGTPAQRTRFAVHDELERRDRSIAHALIQEAKRGAGSMSKREAEALYAKLDRIASAIRGHRDSGGNPKDVRVLREITHVLSKYVGPISRGRPTKRDPDHETTARVELYNLWKKGARNPTNGFYVVRHVNGLRRQMDFKDDERAARAYAKRWNEQRRQ